MQKALGLPPQIETRRDLRRFAADDGLCPGRAGAETALLIDRNVKWLESTQIADGPLKGAWTYPGLGGGDGDNSNSPVRPAGACTRPSASASSASDSDRGGWPRPIGRSARTPTARGATTSRCLQRHAAA